MALAATMPPDSEPPASAPRATSPRGSSAEPSDEALMERVKARDERALQALYGRHAGALFRVAARAVGAESAHEIVQDVLLAAWSKAESFDPSKGSVRPWLLAIARRRVANHRRNEGRRPTGAALADEVVDDLADRTGDADETEQDRLVEAERARALDRAFEALPERERSALRLAFFDELSHDEVARSLGVPMGTAKTRIRSGMKRLRPILIGLGVTAIVLLGLFAVRRADERRALDERALRLVTASDVRTLHLSAAEGVSADVHGNLRTRSGVALTVLTCSNLPLLDRDARYLAWARVGGAVVPLGEAARGDDGKALVVTEDVRLGGPIDEVFVTRELGSPDRPAGPIVMTSRAIAAP